LSAFLGAPRHCCSLLALPCPAHTLLPTHACPARHRLYEFASTCAGPRRDALHPPTCGKARHPSSSAAARQHTTCSPPPALEASAQPRKTSSLQGPQTPNGRAAFNGGSTLMSGAQPNSPTLRHSREPAGLPASPHVQPQDRGTWPDACRMGMIITATLGVDAPRRRPTWPVTTPRDRGLPWSGAAPCLEKSPGACSVLAWHEAGSSLEPSGGRGGCQGSAARCSRLE